jgi:hypothetical protein
MQLAGVSAAVLLLIPTAAKAADDKKKPDPSAMEEVLDILMKDGTIDAATRERLLAKQVAADKKQADVATGFAGLEWFGDLRLRYEGFRFSGDELNNNADNRYRARYRARLGFKKKVSDRASLGLRIASGNSGSTGDLRSTNVSFGEGANDSFSPDGIFIDQAWLDVKIQDSDSFKLGFTAGKVANPYIGKNGLDFLVFDNDINMEGGYLGTVLRPSEPVTFYGTLGAFVIDEDSVPLRTAADDAPSKDQKLVAAQLGTTLGISDSASFGFRTSMYQFRSLDTTFIQSAIANGTSGGGNLAGAFGEDQPAPGAMGRAASLNGKARIGELFTYLDLKTSETLPIKLFGTFVRNFTADSTTFVSGANTLTIDDEEDAYGVGVELGSAKKIALLGVAYYRVESNSVVSSFTDSDLFDGFTNRKGFVVYLKREIVKNVDFGLTYFDAKEIEEDILAGAALTAAAQPLGPSLQNADRRRFQFDIAVKF